MFAERSDRISDSRNGSVILTNLSPHQLTIGVFWLAGGWTLLVWGGRIGLLTGAERSDITSWVRIGGSIAFGVTFLFLAILMWKTESPSGWAGPASWAFLAFSLAVWLPSVLRVVPGDASVAFKAVHVVLAVVSLAIASTAIWVSGRP